MSRILVTGGNGFLAAQVIIVALTKGYQVVATVRSEAKANQTKAALERRLGNKIDDLSFAIVPILEAESALDVVLQAHEFVAAIHTATPCHWNATDPNEMVTPAVGSTKSILASIKNLAPTVKRVIITSSMSAVIDASKGIRPNYVYTEKDWNPITWEETLSGDPMSTYRGAKKWAEKAAWDFIEQERPNFELITICSPYMFGQVAQHVESVAQLNTSSAYLWAILTGQKEVLEPQGVVLFTNVTDVALSHVLSIDAPDAGNKRFIMCSDKPFSNKQISDIFIRRYPHLAARATTRLPEGVDEEGFPSGGYYTADNSLTKEVLGLKYQGLEESVVQFVESVQGWLTSA
ncbi:NAD(P)-binding protein [Serendipita vermifera]|nr:NAD(P)-binding protein [Serendipita vermifera]